MLPYFTMNTSPCRTKVFHLLKDGGCVRGCEKKRVEVKRAGGKWRGRAAKPKIAKSTRNSCCTFAATLKEATHASACVASYLHYFPNTSVLGRFVPKSLHRMIFSLSTQSPRDACSSRSDPWRPVRLLRRVRRLLPGSCASGKSNGPRP